MAALTAILKALRRAVARDLGTFGSLKLNNFFLFIALMVWGALNSGVEPKSAEPLLLLLFLVLVFPLAADPLGKIPSTRLGLWPLTRVERLLLRLASLGYSPVLWLVGIILLVKTVRPALGIAFLLTAIGGQGAAILGSQLSGRAPHWNALRYIPRLPGRLGGLVRKNLREMLSVLDVYIALLLSVGGVIYRCAIPHPDPAAFPILALVIGLAMSTYAQCLFGLDLSDSSMTRYRLLPLGGWEVLLAKDLAYLGVLLLLVLPHDAGAGLTFGLTALGIGHHPSLRSPVAQQRWRFTGSRLFPGVVQAVGSLALGFGEVQRGASYLAVSVVVYLVSLWSYGRYWDRRLL